MNKPDENSCACLYGQILSYSLMIPKTAASPLRAGQTEAEYVHGKFTKCVTFAPLPGSAKHILA